MKNILKLSFFALLFSAVSCEDATDIIQKSELNEDVAFQTVADLQTGLNGVYDSYTPDSGSNGLGDAVLFNDLFTDNMKRGFDGNGQGSSEFNFILQPGDTFPETLWQGRYYTINLVNRTLRAWERIFPTLTEDMDSDRDGISDITEANTIKGELLAFRALCHLDLFEYYTEDYKDPAGLSVIKVDFVPKITDQLQRNTVSEIVDFINDDITQAYTFLGDSNLTTDSGIDPRNYVNKYFVNAVNARLAIDTGDNTTALAVVGDLEEGNFTLSLPSDYQSMFNDVTGAGSELITSLKRLRTNDNQIGALYYANSVDIDGSPFFEMSNQLYDLFSDDDIRKTVDVDPSSQVENNIILIGKYPGTADQLVNDYKIFRLSEMELIKAEAQARLGDLPGAATTVNAIRVARYTANAPAAPQYGSLNDALTDILLERRKELAFEGHRYLDLKRLGGELNIGISRLPIDANSFAAPTDLSANDYRFTLPIPQSELNANNIITQNPGYPANN